MYRQHLRLVSSFTLVLSLVAIPPHSIAQSPSPARPPQPALPAIDSDHDGISDDLEQS